MNKKSILFYFCLIITLVLIPLCYYGNSETVNIKVTASDRIHNSAGGYYLIYTPEETFKNVDNFLYLKWDSSDIQGKLRPSTTLVYTVKVNGFRIPFFSMYRNIVSIKSVQTDNSVKL